LRGWSTDWNAYLKNCKADLPRQIMNSYRVADVVELSADQWEMRYSLEARMVSILKFEECFWSQRAHVHWIK
jgi:hypothetical protein